MFFRIFFQLFMTARFTLFIFLLILGFTTLFYLPDILRLPAYKEKVGENGVYVRQTAERFTLYKDGQELSIAGAGGYANFRLLSEAGANSVRIWDTTRLQTILDSAQHYNLTVAVGLDIGHINHGFDYTDRQAVKEQFDRIKRTVEKHKDHPAILMWVIGNELSSWRTWMAVNDIAGMIHTVDPLHPTTTTMINFQPKNTMLIKWFCPEIDILSINTFGALTSLPTAIDHWLWGWRGPYIVMEWGSSGKWEVETTSWGVPIEHTSTKKAEIMRDRYTSFRQQKDRQCLGDYAFYWGQKNEATPTWFSMFSPHGYPTESVGTLSSIWQGSRQHDTYPQLEYILLNEQGSADNIILQAGRQYESRVVMHDNSQAAHFFQYEIFPETAYPGREEADSLDYLPLYRTTFLPGQDKLNFKAPDKKGAYRLFVYVKDQASRVATSNIPFFVFD